MTSSLARSMRCILCGTSAAGLLPGAGGYRVCAVCDLAWREIDDSPDAAGDWDRLYYGESSIRDLHGRRKSGLAAIARRLTEFSSGKGRLLDIGAGVGIFMEAAAALGWSAEGIEPSPIAARAARQRTGATLHQGLFQEVELPKGAFDAVTFFDALRTVPDPLGFLARARALLKPGGVLLVREVDRRAEMGWQRFRKLLGRAAESGNGGFAYRQCFSPRSLRFAYHEAGLVETSIEPSPVFVETDSESSPMASMVKRSIGAVSGGAYRATAGRLLLGPNLLAFGRAPIADPASRGRA